MNYNNYPQSEVVTSIGHQGLEQQPWWVEQWMELINSYRFKKRLARAWNYAKAGNVTSIRFEGRKVHARVQGTEEEPYKVKLWLDILNDEDWQFVIEALSQKSYWSAQLLAGIMPRDIEQAFAASGRRLFPFELQEVHSECSCPDQANPCKHISAIYFLMSDRFREDPFVLFQLRGRTRDQILNDLGEKRKKYLTEIKSLNIDSFKDKQNHCMKSESDTLNPSKWWKYDGSLHEDLVVIIPSLEDDNGLTEAGDLPLAEDPRFESSRTKFLSHINEEGQKFAQQSMIKAMSSKK